MCSKVDEGLEEGRGCLLWVKRRCDWFEIVRPRRRVLRGSECLREVGKILGLGAGAKIELKLVRTKWDVVDILILQGSMQEEDAET